nr:hypothetical protein HK105_006938 [Polyrhizophydium stewartii]
MLRIIRWWYSKDTKWKENQLRKPYNPILGEQFICSWAVDRHAAPARAATDPTLPSETDPQAADPAAGPDPAFVRCVTEQISHHPPISAFTYTTDDEAIAACGLDHVVARFTGTSFKVGAGEYNAGVYVLLRDSGEEYNISHPWATVNGWLTGSPYIVVSDQVVIVCPKSGLKASYFTRPKFAIEGKIFRHDYSKDAGWSDKERRDAEKLSKIPAADVLCTLSGAWNSRITYRMAGSTEDQLLFDMASSEVAPKIVRPVEEQDPLESRRVWRAVTDALHAKDYSTATKEKRAIEDRQRRIAAEHRAAIENQKHNHTHPAPAAEYESRFFDFKHDIKAGATVRGPPMDMTKGRPYLKPGVLAELFGKRE